MNNRISLYETDVEDSPRAFAKSQQVGEGACGTLSAWLGHAPSDGFSTGQASRRARAWPLASPTRGRPWTRSSCAVDHSTAGTRYRLGTSSYAPPSPWDVADTD